MVTTTESDMNVKAFIYTMDIVQAFVVGLLSADSWSGMYRVPAGMDLVAEQLIASITERFGPTEVVEMSATEVGVLIREAIESHPMVQSWTHGMEVSTLDEPDAIRALHRGLSLDTMILRASEYIRDQRWATLWGSQSA